MLTHPKPILELGEGRTYRYTNSSSSCYGAEGVYVGETIFGALMFKITKKGQFWRKGEIVRFGPNNVKHWKPCD